MNLFRVYGEFTWTTWEFGFGVFFDKPFEIEFLLGPISIGIVFGDQEEKVINQLVKGDIHADYNYKHFSGR